MSIEPAETRAAVLLLFNGRDAALLAFADGLRQRGVDVHPVADVYAAMALLATGLAARHVVVDIRQLDDDEMQFLGLAPRYFPGLQILVPLLEGTIARQHEQTSRAVVLPPADLIESILGIPFAVTADGLEELAEPDEPDDGSDWLGEPVADEPVADEPAVDEPVVDEDEQQAAPLSTDGGPDAADDGPTLHEAVRQRMANDVAGPVRRRPPGQHAAAAFASAPPDAHDENPSSDAGALSAAEIDALLGEPGGGDGASREGESSAGDAA